MTEANIVYSDVKFIKTKEGTTETTSVPDETIYSEVKSDGPQQVASDGGSKITSHKLIIGLLTALLTAAAIGLVFSTYSYFQTMDRLHQLTAENRNLTETCSQVTSPTEKQKTCPAFVNTTNPCVNCQDGWKSFGKQCYYFSNNSLDFGKAREQCLQKGADLVHISSREEQIFLAERVKQLMRKEDDRFWIGLTDSETEGTWLWMDGSPLEKSLEFWISTEPDDWKVEDPERGEDCANLGDRNRNEYCWYDRTCKHFMRSICEKPGKLGYEICAEI